MSIVKVSWSGGKDSTCALALHLAQGDKVKAVCYVPYFTDEIPLISKEHFEWILQTKDRFEKQGAEIHIVSGLTFYNYFYKIVKRGANAGLIYGFPNFCHCSFKAHSKIPAISKCDVGEFNYVDLGIAADETNRQNQIDGEKKRSILMEQGITEETAFEFCRDNNLLSPHYKNNARDGCAICPNAKQRERDSL